MTHAPTNGVDLSVLDAIGEAGRIDRNATRFTFSLKGDWQGGTKMVAETGAASVGDTKDHQRAGRFTMVSDEPVPLGGDAGPSPVEYLLQALGACYTAGIALVAAQRGIQLKHVRLDLEADVDMAGFVGVDASVPPGVSQVRLTADMSAHNAGREELQELLSAVDKVSTLRDTLVRPIDVHTSLSA
ncbi:TPA: OsmC family protein [Stenotrophomonas maltophilia]|uniref:OsmC family protein n=1 Tax=Stenotrophomonas maltophilia TaxID=40324 RepID=A0AAJ2JB74_STEMA|nr:OsmC family protein [Stenotrophomonas maltophilia]MDT3468356.1 OsmC family protein [Stenotrophomonas maltophilia]